jgi:hypothetical protein
MIWIEMCSTSIGGKKLYLKLISRNKRSTDWLSQLIGRNKRSGDWLRGNCIFDLLLAAARARSTYFAKKKLKELV